MLSKSHCYQTSSISYRQTANSWKLAVKCLIAVMLHGSYVLHKISFTGENWIAFLQCYFVFVQEHGGQDLESFVLLNFNEARSLLVQVCRINSSLFFFKFEWVVSLFFLGLIVCSFCSPGYSCLSCGRSCLWIWTSGSALVGLHAICTLLL